MANYTKYHQLHQWEPGDPFLRTDFNEDFAKIDGALGGLAQAHADMDYHLYNLLLQNDYEGKYTGFKRAMLFDGFRDGSGIQSKSGFLRRQSCLALEREGQSDVSFGYGSSLKTDLSTPAATMSGAGVLTGIRFKMQSETTVSADVTFTAAVTVNGTVVWSGVDTFTPPASGKSQEVTFGLSVEVCKGDVCAIRLSSSNSSVRLWTGTRSGTLGGTLTIRSGAADYGVAVGKPLGLPAGQSAVGWVRHKGGTVGLALRSGDSSLRFDVTATRPTVELVSGVSCTEQTFRLDRPVEAGSWQAVLTGGLTAGEASMVVYDYGIAIL